MTFSVVLSLLFWLQLVNSCTRYGDNRVYILTRTSQRPHYFTASWKSIYKQILIDMVHIVSVDDDVTHSYVSQISAPLSECTVVVDIPKNSSRVRFSHNLYLNQLLLETVKLGPGWVYILDDDNVFTERDSLSRLLSISRGDEDTLLVGRVLVGSTVIPQRLEPPFLLGDIDMGCFAFHNSWVNKTARFDDSWGADFRFFQQLASSIGRIRWLNEIVIQTQWKKRSWSLSGKRVDRNF